MIPTFNCGSYLREALAGIVVQDPGPDLMQIEVVDDCSTTDDPKALVNECGQGRILFHRQAQNVGHIRNLTTCLLRARGKLVHILHGDDGVKPGFYEKLQTAFEKEPQIGAAFCRQVFIDEQGQRQGISPLEQSESGILHNWLEHLALEQRIMTPSIVVRRAAYEALGGFDSRLTCAEDWEMWMRIAARYPIWYEPEPLALYRMHTYSNTGRHVRTGEDISYTCRAIEIFKEYLPLEIAERVSRQAKETYAQSALQMAECLCRKGDIEAARAQVRAALFCSQSLKVVRSAASLSVRLRVRSWR
jgi:glycosyltransferase involved in cell wall biosynthesis